jgi:hypothetical protein
MKRKYEWLDIREFDEKKRDVSESRVFTALRIDGWIVGWNAVIHKRQSPTPHSRLYQYPVVMTHFFQLTDKRPDARKKRPELGTLAKTLHMRFNRIPFDPQNE